MKQPFYEILKIPVGVLSQQIPVKLSLLAPLPKLSKLLSHKQKLLARMAKHKGVGCFQVLKFIIQLPRHFVQHRTFQVYHLIMGDHQNVFLTVGICHGEGHLIMIEFTEIGIQLHVLQKVVHPTHVPFQGKTKAVVLCLSCYLWPGSRFLCDHYRSMISSKHHGI
ncbi:hypothetical protein EVA_06390 [gut metagenome]|uniref:Uncharacterized protein n=1 Tax=gut metagenome TaxID=749906 RepID=J9GDS0_9ZZZZ